MTDVPAKMAGWLAKGIWAVFGQGALAASTFVLSFSMARYAPLREFGIFATLFSIHAFFRAVVAAAIYGPMPFLAPSWQGQAVNAYLRGLAVLHWLGVLALTGTMAILVWIGGRFFVGTDVVNAALAMLLSLPFVTWIEFGGKAAIQHKKPQVAFILTGTFLLVQVLTLFCLVHFGYGSHNPAGSLNSIMAFLSMAFSAALILPLNALLDLLPPGGKPIALSLIVLRSRRFTTWGVVNIFITQGYIQILYLTVAALAGAGAVGLLEGPRLVVAPLVILLTAWGAISSPPAAQRFAESGMRAMMRFYFISSVPLLGVSLLYLGFVNFFPARLFVILFGHGFANSAGNLMLWSLTMVAMIIATVAGSFFYPAHRPEFGTLGRLAAAVATISLLYPAVRSFGSTGAIGIRMIGEAVTMLVNIAFVIVLLRKGSLAKKGGETGA